MIDQPDSIRLIAANTITSEDKLLGSRLPNQSRESLCSTRARDDGETGLRQSKNGTLSRNSHISAKGHLTAATQSCTVYHGYSWATHLFQVAKSGSKVE